MNEKKRFTHIIPEPIEKYFIKLRAGNERLDYGRDIVVNWTKRYIDANRHQQNSFRIVDIGAGGGEDLCNIKKSNPSNNLQLVAIESYEPNVRQLSERGIESFKINIELERLPFEDNSVDVIVANQVIEHTKDIFFIFSEISRVLKIDGITIIGFPNLAALHNRFLLLLGEQPICIRMPGPHVRGITKGAFCQFITTDDYFRVNEITGSNFYPFPPGLAQKLAAFFPSLAISLFFVCQRTNKKGTFIDVLSSRFYETNFLVG